MGALALGTDTGGSVRLPAAGCGVVGLKTPFGAIATDGVFPLAPDLDTVGPMARTVEDCALAWSVLSGEPVPEPSLEGKRIGKLVRLPSLGEAEAGPHDPHTDALPGEPVELPVPEADVWPVFYGGAAESHRGLYPERAAEYGPVISAKLDRALATTPEAYEQRPRGDGRVAARGGGGPAGRRDRLARCSASRSCPRSGRPRTSSASRSAPTRARSTSSAGPRSPSESRSWRRATCAHCSRPRSHGRSEIVQTEMPRIAEGLHRLGSDLINFYLVEDATGLTVVDAGVPAFYDKLAACLGELGRDWGDINALVLTHAHSDHVGFAERLRTEHGVPVLVHAADEQLAHTQAGGSATARSSRTCATPRRGG